MPRIGSRNTHGILSLIELTNRYCRNGSHFTLVSSHHQHISRSTPPKFEHGRFIHRGLQLVNANSGASTTLRQKVVANLARWFVASMISLLPFFKQKWDKTKMIEGEVECVVEEVETAAEVVEKIATVTEKISGEIAEKLPNNGKLEEIVLYVEHISETIANDAKSTKDIAEKVEKLKNDFDNTETLIDQALKKIINQN